MDPQELPVKLPNSVLEVKALRKDVNDIDKHLKATLSANEQLIQQLKDNYDSVVNQLRELQNRIKILEM